MCIRMIVGRTNQADLFIHHLIDLPSAQSMVASGNDICAAVKNLFGGKGKNTIALCRIFTVDQYKVRPVLFFQLWHLLPQKVAASLSNHISYR